MPSNVVDTPKDEKKWCGACEKDANQKAHRKTPRGKSERKVQNASPSSKAARARYAETDNGKAVNIRAHKKFTAKIRREARALVRAAKDVPCVECGKTFHFAAMDFDHVRGVKRGNVSTMASKTFSLETLRAEMAKCDVICANCHRIRTYERKTGKRVALGA